MRLLFVLLLLGLANPAQAQKTQAELLTEIMTNLPSGQPNVLTAASLRSVLNDMVTSSVLIRATSMTINTTITSAATDITNAGIVTGIKHTNYTVPALVAGIQPVGYFENNISDGVWGNAMGVQGRVNNSNTQHSQPGSTASAVAVYGTGFCLVVGCSATWGSNLAAYDTSGQADPPFPLVGLEVDNYAHGTDAHGNRIGVQIVAGSPDAGAVNTVTHGLMFVGNGAGGASGGQYVNLIDGFTAKAVNGIVMNSMTISGFAFLSPGFGVDGQGATTMRSLRLTPYTVATLPPCTSGNAGEMVYVNDAALGPVWNTALTGGGGGVLPVNLVCQGGAWAYH